MRVCDVMTSPVVTVTPDAKFADLVDRLLTANVSGLPVVDARGSLVGIVTEADLVSKEAYGYRRRRPLGLVSDYLRGHDPQWVRKAAGRTAREIMSAEVATASPDDDVAFAARLMLASHHKRLPVVDEGRVVGIVSRHDLLRPFGRGDDAVLKEIDDLLANVLRVPETHEASAAIAAGVVTLTGSVQWPSDIQLLEAVVARVPGVVAVDNRLTAREPDPRVTGVLQPPLR